MTQTYNIYCDESRVENRESNNMVIGALFMPREEKRKIIGDLKKIYKKHNFKHELKWTKVNKGYLVFYQEIINYFLREGNLSFRCIVVDKSKIKLNEFHNDDLELAFFKFYYLMLKAKLLNNNAYYIFLDKKPIRDRNRARALHAFLDSYILLSKQECGVKHFQAYSSENNLLLQLADFFTGLMGFACNENRKIYPKGQIVDYLKEKLQRDNLCITSYLREEKFNVFVWEEKI